jgi:hypothetical protein
VEYEYQTLRDHVSASDAQEYITNIERMKDELGFYLTQPLEDVTKSSTSQDTPESKTVKDKEPFKDKNTTPKAFYDELNWTILLLATVIIGLGIFATSKVYVYSPALPSAPLEPYDSRLQGLGGWLLLIAFVVCMNPIRLLSGFASNVPAYSHSRWIALTTPGAEEYHALWQPLLIFELLLNLLLIVFSVLMVILFFQKRYTFPKVYTLFMLASFLGQALDFMICQGIPFLHEQQTPNDKTRLIGNGVGVLIWALYFAKSRRVKLTFTKTLSGRNVSEEQNLQTIQT